MISEKKTVLCLQIHNGFGSRANPRWELPQGADGQNEKKEEERSGREGRGEEGAPLVIPIDQHFNVKGVGLVAIGYVQAGTVSKHDEILVLPAQETGIARSLQVMDDDVEQSFIGDRVGVALRNLREESLHRGCILTHGDVDALIRHNGSTFTLSRAPFQKRELSKGDVVHAAVDLQFQVGRVSTIQNDEIVVEWEQPLWIQKRDAAPVIIVQLDAGNMRVMGTAQVIAPARE